jgi:hypothetical protein
VSARRAVPVVAALVVAALVVAFLVVQAGATRTETGVVVDVDATSLTDVTAFTIRVPDGGEIRFRIDRLENGAEFPPGHLQEHVATSQPVVVFYRDEGGERVAYRLEDAPAG